MTAAQSNQPASPARRPAAAFTLVEILVVIVILGVLISLVVGVAWYLTDKAARSATTGIQTILMRAVYAYQDAQGAYPREETNLGSPPGSGYGTGFTPDQWNAVVRIRKLWALLSAVPQSKKIIQSLPADAAYAKEKVFRDGYGFDMDYRDSAGLGATPVVISPGRDGRFGGSPYDSDNIRSDGKGQ